MRKLYDEFFYIPKHGKIREKVMLARVVTTAMIMIFCLVAMGFTAYAYFSYNVTSGSHIIKAASFETNVSITIEPIDNISEEDPVITTNQKAHSATLNGGTTYKVTITPSEKSTAKTGFVILTASNCNSRYHTQQLGKDGDATTGEVSFYIQANATTEVTLLAHWGTSTYYGYAKENNELYITQGETVVLAINGAEDQKTPTTETTQPTTPETTQPGDTTTPDATQPTAPSDSDTTDTGEPTDTTATDNTTDTAVQPTAPQETQTEQPGTDSTEQSQLEATEPPIEEEQ